MAFESAVGDLLVIQGRVAGPICRQDDGLRITGMGAKRTQANTRDTKGGNDHRHRSMLSAMRIAAIRRSAVVFIGPVAVTLRQSRDC